MGVVLRQHPFCDTHSSAALARNYRGGFPSLAITKFFKIDTNMAHFCVAKLTQFLLAAGLNLPASHFASINQTTALHA